MFDDAKRADRKDWKLKAEHKGDKCFNKHFPIGKVYYLKVSGLRRWLLTTSSSSFLHEFQKAYNLDMETLFTNHWKEVGAFYRSTLFLHHGCASRSRCVRAVSLEHLLLMLRYWSLKWPAWGPSNAPANHSEHPPANQSTDPTLGGMPVTCGQRD